MGEIEVVENWVGGLGRSMGGRWIRFVSFVDDIVLEE